MLRVSDTVLNGDWAWDRPAQAAIITAEQFPAY